MTFLNPILVAAGLGCIAIPILIHLLMRRRRRPVEWGAMKFLLDAYRRQRRRLNLEQLLLLAARCLLIGLLALAVGKPILGAAGVFGARGPRTVYIVIDNSLTASAVEAASTALDRHKAAAVKLIGELDAGRGDRVGVVALGAPAEGTVMPPSADLAGVAAIVKTVDVTDARADVEGGFGAVRDDLRRAREAGGARDATVVVLSDFRTGSADTSTPLRLLAEEDPPVRVLASAPGAASAENSSIVAVEPLVSLVVAGNVGGNESVPVRVEIRRSGDAANEATGVVRLALYRVGDDRPISRPMSRPIRWATGQDQQTLTLPLDFTIDPTTLRPGALGLVVRASLGDDLIAGDNAFARPIDVRTRLRVALVGKSSSAAPTSVDAFSPDDWLTLALAPSDDGSLRTRRAAEVEVQSIDAARDLSESSTTALGPLAGFDVAFITAPHAVDGVGWRRLRAAAEAGVLLVFAPAPDETIHVWPDAMKDALGVPWTISREPRTLVPPLSPDPARSSSSLFAMIAPELPDLARPVTFSRILTITARPESLGTVLALSDGSPVIVASSGEARTSEAATPGSTPGQPTPDAPRGNVVVLASAISTAWTDLPTKPLMVPLVQELVRQGLGGLVATKLATSGVQPRLPADASELVRADLATSDGPAASISVDAAGRTTTPLRRTGVWNVRTATGRSAGLLTVNADAAAGSVNPRSPEDVVRWLGGLSDEVSIFAAEGDPGVAESGAAMLAGREEPPPISLPLLIAAGVVALIELVLARVFSHAQLEGASLGSTILRSIRATKDAA